jgi:hypothetical protein
LPVAAAPLLSAQQRNSLTGICAATGTALTATNTQTGVLLYDTAGSLPAAHDELPATLRAASFAASGLVVCRTTLATEVETCRSAFFSFKRVRVDHALRVVAVRAPRTTLASTQLQGSAPPACNAAGTITSDTTAIYGDAPTLDALLAFLDSSGVNRNDTDGDGLDNLSELVQLLDPLDAADPGALTIVTANNSKDLRLDEGEALTIKLTFKPGQYFKQPADYYLWSESRTGGIFSYIHPGQFVATDAPLLSARAKAIVLDEFPVLTLEGLGVGDYTLHFEVRVNGTTAFTDTATFTISPNAWHFTDVASAAGITHLHGYDPVASDVDISRDRQYMAAGVAAGDYDKDGWVDLYVTRGSLGPNLLYRNLGDGTFVDVAAAAGVVPAERCPHAGVALDGLCEYAGATFADYDGDGWLDLLVSGINTTTQPKLFRNNRNGTFTDVTATAGIPIISQSMGSTFADYDKDGDLDFWITHWTANRQNKYLFRNNLSESGSATFTDASVQAGIPNELMGDYTVNFADINNDGWPDILVAADFSTSQVYLNQRNGSFGNATTTVVKGAKNGGTGDENGMGAAVGDYDNDGDLDWFVSSIYDARGPGSALSGAQSWGDSGNRFYMNPGTGIFSDITSFTGTRAGGWGWGACFADFNNDGYLDLFHVNGYDSADFNTEPFRQDASRLFINDHEGGFIERSVALGIDDKGQGRGIVCFDYDRDGDIDIFVANNQQQALLYENRELPQAHWLHIRLEGERQNSEAIGARVYVTAGGVTQMRELSAGSNFMSQNPVYAYFGLGDSTTVDSVRVVWPSGDERTLEQVPGDQVLYIAK